MDRGMTLEALLAEQPLLHEDHREPVPGAVADDVQIWTGAVLKVFLASEPEWTVYRDFSPRSVVYRKEVDGLPYKEWTAQAFMHSGMALEPPSRLRRVWALLREGNFGELGRR